jgi:hypothetical protein
MQFLRPLLGYTKSDHQRNVDIRKKLEVQSIAERIQTYQKSMLKGCKMTDYQNWHLNTNEWENNIQSIPKRDGKTSSWKRAKNTRLKNLINKIKRRFILDKYLISPLIQKG